MTFYSDNMTDSEFFLCWSQNTLSHLSEDGLERFRSMYDLMMETGLSQEEAALLLEAFDDNGPEIYGSEF